MNPAITSRLFGESKEKTPVKVYTLKNSNGIEVEVLNYGGIIRAITLPDRKGNFQNCVLGFDSFSDYEKNTSYFGALIGRFSNRIAKGKFSLKGETYTLAQNHGIHHLHGGNKGLDKVIWAVKEIQLKEGVGVVLTHKSLHMDEGYPGTLSIQVTYGLTDQNTLTVDYAVQTDRPTIINLTQHSYFNLSGNPKQNCLDHDLQIHANSFLEVDQELIPTGKKVAVQNTPFDFTSRQNIGKAIKQTQKQLALDKGYDHCYCFDQNQQGLKHAASLLHKNSGRKMEVHTTSPGMQLYTANHLIAPFVPYGAVCLETQAYPDSPNQPDFPSTIIIPEVPFSATTHFHFSIHKNI